MEGDGLWNPQKMQLVFYCRAREAAKGLGLSEQSKRRSSECLYLVCCMFVFNLILRF